MSSMFHYDQTLLAAVQARPRSIAEVLQTMRAIDTACIDGDGLKWFNWLYLQVTAAVEARVALTGGFTHAAWLAALDVQFAGLYFDALKASLSGRPAPGCWRVLFARRNQTAIARIQFALAGVNAHINHDLPMALVATCADTGSAPQYGGTHYRDYTALNNTLNGLVDLATQALHVRLLGDALPPVSHLEDTLAAFSVSAAREAAWHHAELLWALRGSPPLAARTLDVLDGTTSVIGKTILVPVPLA
jgi:hypothetical protein